MAFESLSDKLTEAFKRLRGKGRLTEADVKEAMREVKLALLEADVNFKVVKDFVRKVTERATGADVLESLSPAQMVIKIVNEELTALMGSENQKLNISSQSPSVVMLVGLQGAGKTCTVPRPSSSSRPAAASSTFPCSRWGRATRSRSRRPASSTRKSTATTLSFSTRPAACTSTRRP